MSTAAADPFGWAGATIETKYRVDEVIGEGGFGVVYRGQHLGFDEPVAIKVLKVPATLQGAAREDFFKTFVAEGKLLHRLSRGTAGIVQALDVGAATSPNGTWTPYLIMEWLGGSTLERDLVDRRARGAPPRSLGDAMALLEPAARALAAAHAQGIAHRDVKPANLFLADIAGHTTLKVLDFGIAKVLTEVANVTQAMAETGGSIRSFTPQYGAPEQFHRQFGATGPWTDVFALALVLVELVCDKRALDGSDTTQLYILSTDPTQRPTLRNGGAVVDDAVENVVAKALAVDPRSRYREAGAFWDALVAAAGKDAGHDGGSPRASGADDARAELRPTSSPLPREALASMPTGEFLDAIATGPNPGPAERGPRGDVTLHDQASATSVDPPRSTTTGEPVTGAPRAVPAIGHDGGKSTTPRADLDGAPAPAPLAAGPAGTGWHRVLGVGIAVALVGAGAGLMAVLQRGPSSSPTPSIQPAASASADAPASSASTRLASSVVASESRTVVRIPAGKFMMGTALGGKTERPVHEVTFSHAFDLDVTEVTAGDFQRCVDAGKCTPSRIHGPHVDEAQIAKLTPACTGGDPARARHPVNCVDQSQAAAYCAFVGKRLPTEAEWEYAARGTDGRDYPWGTSPPSCERGNFSRPIGESCGGRPKGTIEVGSLPMGKSAFGALDMAGNVWEWVADGWDPQAYQHGPQTDPIARFSGAKGVLRGGSWDFDAGTSRSTFRLAFDSTEGGVSTGFRCAKTVDPAPGGP